MLLTPGPVPLPDFVRESLQRPVIPHRSAEFSEFYGALLDRLRYLFLTSQSVSTMIASGTGGVEAALYSLFRPGDSVLVVENGKFSARWSAYGQMAGWDLHCLTLPWGEVPSPGAIVAQLRLMGNPAGLVLTHCETSTGALLDLEEVAFAVRQHFPSVCITVDAITAVGALPFYFDDWQIDCAVVASQKALMNPAGVAAFALSERALDRLRASDPGDYRNLYNYVRWAERNNYPFTPPVSLLYGLDAALRHIQDRELPSVWNTVHQSAHTFRKGLQQLGGELWGRSPSDSLSVFSFPGRDADALRAGLRARGLLLSGGQNEWKGRILRVSHMGLAQAREMEELLLALKEELG